MEDEVKGKIAMACKYLDRNGISTRTSKKKGAERLDELVLRINNKLSDKEWFEMSVSRVALEAFKEWASRQTIQRIQGEYIHWRRVEHVVPTVAQVRVRCPSLPKSFEEARDRINKAIDQLRQRNSKRSYSNHYLRIT